MKVVVCGGRDYQNPERVFETLDGIDAEHGITLLATGDALGADLTARTWAGARGKTRQIFRADWKKWGAGAGPIRNATMLKRVEPDLVIAFPGGKGTADTIRKARAAGIAVLEVDAPDVGCASDCNPITTTPH